RANERVHVGVVDRRVGRDKWRLAVAGRSCATGAQDCDPGGQGEPERGECRARAACSRDAHCSSFGTLLARVRSCRIRGWVAVRFRSLTHPRRRLLRIRRHRGGRTSTWLESVRGEAECRHACGRDVAAVRADARLASRRGARQYLAASFAASVDRAEGGGGDPPVGDTTCVNGDKDALVALTRRMAELGAPEPDSWARSEITEGIPQQARYLLLRRIWANTLVPWRDPGMLRRNEALAQLLDRGPTRNCSPRPCAGSSSTRSATSS